ncbi:hypothetical protein [uncultured Prevotella sp.]|uniref:hypothetical protein n=1 Tax=uncultured Prevotella sp. TaxID=159272 RepID=UPI0025937079|nr:hypothetical protein [uncultured Prevotella sp.]
METAGGGAGFSVGCYIVGVAARKMFNATVRERAKDCRPIGGSPAGRCKEGTGRAKATRTDRWCGYCADKRISAELSDFVSTGLFLSRYVYVAVIQKFRTAGVLIPHGGAVFWR